MAVRVVIGSFIVWQSSHSPNRSPPDVSFRHIQDLVYFVGDDSEKKTFFAILLGRFLAFITALMNHAQRHEGPLESVARIVESAPRNARKLAQSAFFYVTPEIEGSVWMMIRDVHLPFAQRVRQPLN